MTAEEVKALKDYISKRCIEMGRSQYFLRTRDFNEGWGECFDYVLYCLDNYESVKAWKQGKITQ